MRAMANTKGAQAVVVAIGALGVIAALAVLWIFISAAGMAIG